MFRLLRLRSWCGDNVVQHGHGRHVGWIVGGCHLLSRGLLCLHLVPRKCSTHRGPFLGLLDGVLPSLWEVFVYGLNRRMLAFGGLGTYRSVWPVGGTLFLNMG